MDILTSAARWAPCRLSPGRPSYVRVLAPPYFGELAAPVPVLGRAAAVATIASALAVILVGLAAEPFTRAFAEASLLGR